MDTQSQLLIFRLSPQGEVFFGSSLAVPCALLAVAVVAAVQLVMAVVPQVVRYLKLMG